MAVDAPDFEQMLIALCRQSHGDVHLDLAEVDSIDVASVISLLRVATALDDDRHLVLRNPPAVITRIVSALGPAAARAGLRIVG